MALGTKIPQFTLVRELGSAGATQLFLARQEGLERQAVVRVMRRDQLGIGIDQLRRFEEEGRILARIQHQGVARVYQIGDTGEVLFRAMEYLGGGSLLESMERGPLRPRQAVGCCGQVAEALNALHQAGVFQRALCPSRILFRDTGLPVLTDLGAMGAMGDIATASASDAVGPGLGETGYCSPEVLEGGPPDARSDAFALGLMLHAMLTGNLSCRGASPTKTDFSQIGEELKRLPAEVADLQPVLSRMLTRDPSQRYQNMFELLDDLPARARESEEQEPDQLRKAAAKRPVRRTLRNLSLGSAMVVAATIFAAWQLGPARLSEPDRMVIELELRNFNEYMARMDIYGPADSNATASLERMMAISRDHPAVRQAAGRLADIYLRDAHDSYVRRALEDALKLLQKGEGFFPEHQNLAPLRLEINRALAEQRVADLLAAADDAISRRNLMPPAAGNAYSVLREVQSIDPGNESADSGLREIQLHIAEQARGAWSKEGVTKARQMALSGRKLFPDSVLLNDLLTDLDDAVRND